MSTFVISRLKQLLQKRSARGACRLGLVLAFTAGTATVWAQTPKAISADNHWVSVVIKPGDTLQSIFKRLHIKGREAVILGQQYPRLKMLNPKQQIEIQITPAHEVAALKYPLPHHTTLLISRETPGHFTSQRQSALPKTTMAYKSFTVYSSLRQSAKHAGVTPQMLTQLQKLFANKVDFSSQIQSGDRFDFIYEDQEYPNTVKHDNGAILAASFTHKNKSYRVLRYTDPRKQTTKYYTETGLPIESQFLAAPLHYKRISSGFSMRRFDPVLHKIRPHLGTDFAAPQGTPIKSIGDGRVVFVGRYRGFGNTIKIQYGAHYVGLYAHLSRFAQTIRINQSVKKGETIGYVGSTGWATGPHLHFGFYVNGQARDWLAWSARSDLPVSKEKHFMVSAQRLLDQLQFYSSTTVVADNRPNPL